MPETTERQSGTPDNRAGPQPKGIGFGIFLLLAGISLLGEKLGWFPQQFDWVFPAILIAWGASELYQRLNGN